MEFYNGLRGDKPIGGGSFVDEEGIGFEAFNYRTYRGMKYGYFRPPGMYYDGNLNINRIDSNTDNGFIDNVTVIWFSKRPFTGRQYIVGWFKNARVYDKYQLLPASTRRIIPKWDANEVFGYFITAKAKDSVLLDIDNRTFQVPQGAGWSGQSNIWYCDAGTRQQKKFLKEVEFYIKYRTLPSRLRKRHATIKAYQRDEKRKRKIELASMKAVVQYYSDRGYKVSDVHNENLGYALEAVYLKERLRIEVKGLSGHDISVEMTPNEFEKMEDLKPFYRVGIVTKSLKEKQDVHVFRYSDEKRHWLDQNNRILQIQKRIGARLFA